MKFFLGTHLPRWLWDARFQGIPLFVSARTLRKVKTLRRAATDWGLDSGGFTELTAYGKWSIGVEEYANEVRSWSARIGRLVWAAPQDWMCEEFVCASTALAEDIVKPEERKLDTLVSKIPPRKRTVSAMRTARVLACLPLDQKLWSARIRVHQARTVTNFLALRAIAPELPIAPVLQGYAVADYLRHARDYASAGVDLTLLPLVGVGSVCRRQAQTDAAEIIGAIRGLGIRPHGFGFKKEGIRLAGRNLESSDSLAWSFGARLRPPLPGCRHGKSGTGKCNNCPLYALAYYDSIAPREGIELDTSF